MCVEFGAPLPFTVDQLLPSLLTSTRATVPGAVSVAVPLTENGSVRTWSRLASTGRLRRYRIRRVANDRDRGRCAVDVAGFVDRAEAQRISAVGRRRERVVQAGSVSPLTVVQRRATVGAHFDGVGTRVSVGSRYP